MTKPKYVTKAKRIRQLEKEVQQLQQQVKTLTELLDQTTTMIYRQRPALARSIERDFHDELLPSQLPLKIQIERSNRRIRRLPLLPRPDLVNK